MPHFDATLRQDRDRFVITYVGHLPEFDIDALVEAEKRILARPRGSTLLFVQAEGFTGFHRAQVSKHAQALARMKNNLKGVAIANASGAVRFAIASVSMLTRVPLKGFESVIAANHWLDSVAGDG